MRIEDWGNTCADLYTTWPQVAPFGVRGSVKLDWLAVCGSSLNGDDSRG